MIHAAPAPGSVCGTCCIARSLSLLCLPHVHDVNASTNPLFPPHTHHHHAGKKRKHDPLPERCEGWALRLGEWDAMEIEVLDRLRFFTAKPMIYVLNVPVREHTRRRAEWRERLQKALRQMELGTGFVVPLSVQLENRLADNRRAGTLEHYLLANPSHLTQIPELNMQTARSLDLITFYTGVTPLSTPGCVCRKKGVLPAMCALHPTHAPC